MSDAPEGTVEVGRITKSHGLKGDVLVQLSTNRLERIEAGASFLTSDGSELTIAESAVHQDRWRGRTVRSVPIPPARSGR